MCSRPNRAAAPPSVASYPHTHTHPPPSPSPAVPNQIDPKRAVPRTGGQQRPAPAPPASSKPMKIFVGGLPPTATEESLREYFGTFGRVCRAAALVLVGR